MLDMVDLDGVKELDLMDLIIHGCGCQSDCSVSKPGDWDIQKGGYWYKHSVAVTNN